MLRDQLAKAYKGTLIGDEADCASKKTEGLFGLRCSPTARVAFKRAVKEQQYRDEVVPVFGAIVLHHRRPFLDPSNQNRAISIRTALRKEYFIKMEDLVDAIELWSPRIPAGRPPQLGEGRAYDTWYPLLAMVAGAGDNDWLDWAKARIDEAVAEVRDGQEFEPESVIFAKIVEVFTNPDTGKVDLDFKRRVPVDRDIVRPLQRDYPWVNPYSAAQTVRRLHLLVRRDGGCNWVYPTEETLRKAADYLGYRDEALP